MLFRKADRFCSPASTWTVQNSLDNADAGRPLTQDCPAPLVDSPTEHYTNTGKHSSSLWLSFLAIVQQGRALERHLHKPLNGTSMLAMPTGNIPETSEVGTPSLLSTL